MRFGNLFNMVEDAQGICSVFDGVETPEQMVSALERLKKQAPHELLELVSSLRLSTEAVLADTLEPNGTLGEGEPPDDLGDLDLENLGEGDDEKSEIPAEAVAAKK